MLAKERAAARPIRCNAGDHPEQLRCLEKKNGVLLRMRAISITSFLKKKLLWAAYLNVRDVDKAAFPRQHNRHRERLVQNHINIYQSSKTSKALTKPPFSEHGRAPPKLKLIAPINPAALLRFMRSLHNTSTPSARADLFFHLRDVSSCNKMNSLVTIPMQLMHAMS